MGRKPKKEADKRSSYVRVMLTAAELKDWEAIAKEDGADTSAWVRTEITKIIRKRKEKK